MNKPAILLVILIVALIGLLWWSRSVSQDSNNSATAAFWPGTDIACLRFGHQNIAQHIHPVLKVLVDGQEEGLPANIGVTPSCMAEAHTHDASGTLHFESVSATKTFTLGDFLKVWGRDIARDGYTHSVTINDEVVGDVETRVLQDEDRVVISYTSAAKAGGVSEEKIEEPGTETLQFAI